MNLVLDQLKGVLSDSIAKFLKENIKLDDTDIKTIFGENMDKVLYHDEGFLKDLSSKMSDVVMPAYMKELRYLKKIVSGVDEVTKSMKALQDRMEKDMAAVVPNPKNASETTNKMNQIVEEFIKKATELTKTKIGLREVLPGEVSKEEGKTEESSVSSVFKPSTVQNETPLEKASALVSPSKEKASPTAAVIKPIENVVLSTPSDITNALSDEILNIINQKKAQRGGSSAQPYTDLQSGTSAQSAQRDLQSGGLKMPDIEPQINEYIESHEKVPRIPKRNYTEYDGNLSQLLNQIVREKMTDFENKQGLSDKIMNSKSYKDVLASVNELFISKPDLQAMAINQLVQTIKESKISDKALQKVIESAAKQIKSAKGGTRKKR
jgi:hypothetical protein